MYEDADDLTYRDLLDERAFWRRRVALAIGQGYSGESARRCLASVERALAERDEDARAELLAGGIR